MYVMSYLCFTYTMSLKKLPFLAYYTSDKYRLIRKNIHTQYVQILKYRLQAHYRICHLAIVVRGHALKSFSVHTVHVALLDTVAINATIHVARSVAT